MDNRQEQLLKVIVETYVKTVKPVGSKSLCQKFNCSSATIRNEMAVLENLGYIEKNHISSGRIPSEKGYRYYVENLMEPEKLNGSDILKLQKVFRNSDLVLTDAISKCMEIISDLTNYASVVLGSSSEDNLLKQVTIIPIDDFKVVALVCTNKGIVENKKFALDEKTDIKELIKTCEIINKMLIGTPIKDVSERLEFEIKPIIASKIINYEKIYNIFYNAFTDFIDESSNVVVNGKAKVLEQPEYNDPNSIKKLAYKLEDKDFIKKVTSDDGTNEYTVYIGTDSNVDDNTTVIKRSYEAGGEKGTIAIIGPKRMDYARVYGLLDYVLKEIEKK